MTQLENIDWGFVARTANSNICERPSTGAAAYSGVELGNGFTRRRRILEAFKDALGSHRERQQRARR